MKKKFKMTDIDCANCAAKMEDAVKKIPGVEDAVISFMTQKLTLVAPEEDMDRILDEAQNICRKIEPDVTIVRK